MDNTSGFYKLEDGTLLFGPNGVTGPSFDLQAEVYNQYIYPVEGWYWFDSEEEARVQFGLEPLQNTEIPDS